MPGLNTDDAIEAIHVTPVPRACFFLDGEVGVVVFDLERSGRFWPRNWELLFLFGHFVCPLQLLSCIFLDFLLTKKSLPQKVQHKEGPSS